MAVCSYTHTHEIHCCPMHGNNEWLRQSEGAAPIFTSLNSQTTPATAPATDPHGQSPCNYSARKSASHNHQRAGRASNNTFAPLGYTAPPPPFSHQSANAAGRARQYPPVRHPSPIRSACGVPVACANGTRNGAMLPPCAWKAHPSSPPSAIWLHHQNAD